MRVLGVKFREPLCEDAGTRSARIPNSTTEYGPVGRHPRLASTRRPTFVTLEGNLPWQVSAYAKNRLSRQSKTPQPQSDPFQGRPCGPGTTTRPARRARLPRGTCGSFHRSPRHSSALANPARTPPNPPRLPRPPSPPSPPSRSGREIGRAHV